MLLKIDTYIQSTDKDTRLQNRSKMMGVAKTYNGKQNETKYKILPPPPDGKTSLMHRYMDLHIVLCRHKMECSMYKTMVTFNMIKSAGKHASFIIFQLTGT